MNIAIVSIHARPSAGVPPYDNSAVHITGLARELGRLGHDVTVYSHGTCYKGIRKGRRVRLAPGVTVEHLSAVDAAPAPEDDLLTRIPEFADHLAQRWAKDRPDVIHAHNWLGGLAALSGSRDLDIPVVQTFHDLATFQRRAGVACSDTRARLEKAIGHSVSAVIATTGSECAGLVGLGVPRPRIATVPSGVEVERFTPRGAALPQAGTARLLVIAEPGERQVATAIQALVRIPGAELVVAGGPPIDELDGDDDIHRLRVMAKEEGVAERVTFVGAVDPDRLPDLLRSADITISLPSHQGFGRVAVESMACGTPVVVSAVGGHLDAVIDGVTGLHLPPDRPLELARRIRALLAEPTRLAALGIAGADRARSRYSWERIARETLKVYQSLLPSAEPAEPDSMDDDSVDQDLDTPILAAAS
jgi:glycosyltransferase involved in cell wall biosynthesis